jgi:hypothetical protein
VSSSRALKWSVFILLLLSIALKIAVPPDNQDNLTDALVEFFKRNHFSVQVTEQLVNYMPIITANTASCHLQIARLTADGSNRDFIRSLATGTDRVFVVFRGRAYVQQPIFWTVLNYFWSRFLRELGWTRRIETVIAVATNSSCDAETLPWEELRGVL